MRNFILCMMLGIACCAEVAHAEVDGDHDVRPRPEYDPLQQEILLAPRNPVDPSMKLYATSTTNFGRYGFVNLTESAEPEAVWAP